MALPQRVAPFVQIAVAADREDTYIYALDDRGGVWVYTYADKWQQLSQERLEPGE